MKLDVAVIGAGMAGASAARRLQDAGLQVAVFDKARGAGGRMSTRRITSSDPALQESGVQFDHGAQYFTARDPRFQSTIEYWLEQGVVSSWAGKLVEINHPGIFTPKTDTLTRYLARPTQNALVKAMLRGVSCQFDRAIARIERTTGIERTAGIEKTPGSAFQNHGFALYDQHGQLIAHSERLAVCVPAPQASVLLTEFSDAKHYADQADMQPCWALMLQFAERLALDFDGAFVNTGELSWIARDSSKPGRPSTEAPRAEAWIAHANPSFSASIIEHSPEQAQQILLVSFQRLFGVNSIATPIFSTAHRWRYALGGRQDPHVDAHYFDAKSGLGLAGDWCGTGRVEGAFLSGLALAEAMLDKGLA